MEEIIKYLNDILETNKNGVSKEILRRAELRYPQHFILDLKTKTSIGRLKFQTNMK